MASIISEGLHLRKPTTVCGYCRLCSHHPLLQLNLPNTGMHHWDPSYSVCMLQRGNGSLFVCLSICYQSTASVIHLKAPDKDKL